MPIELGLGAVIVVVKEGIKVVGSLKDWIDRTRKGILEEEDLRFLGDDVGVIMGEGNIHKPTAGASEYIRGAASGFLHASGKLRGAVKYVEPEDLAANRNLGGLLLGGPVANAAYRRYCGYEMVPAQDGKPDIPIWQPNRLRWGFFLGVGNWGDTPVNRRLGTNAALEPLKVARWSPDGKLTPNLPRYGIVDNEGTIAMLEVNDKGILMEDYVLVTRLEREDAPGRYLTMIAGTHGYSTAAFGRDWRKHIKFLREASDRHGQEFQALIPARLNEITDINEVKLDLECAKIAPVG